MLINTGVNIYHKGFDDINKIEIWEKHYFENAWCFGGKGSSINKGYDGANDIDVRLWYSKNPNLKIEDIAIGDIIVPGEENIDITTQQDLQGIDVYNVTSINNNNFGSTPHIHLGGK